jgi:hypothetical protein
MERIATPWYGRRRLRLFCDHLTLGAQSLDDTIRSAMDDSRYLVALASSVAAACAGSGRSPSTGSPATRMPRPASSSCSVRGRCAGTRPPVPMTATACHHRSSGPASSAQSGSGSTLRGAHLAKPDGSDEPLGEAVAKLAAELLGMTKDAVRGQEFPLVAGLAGPWPRPCPSPLPSWRPWQPLRSSCALSGEQVTQRELVARSRSLAAAALRETAPDLAPLLATQAPAADMDTSSAVRHRRRWPGRTDPARGSARRG